MPDYLPDRLEAGTLNVPGYAGLTEGLRFVRRTGVENIFRREHRQLERCAEGLQKLGMEVFAGAHQASTVSFRPEMDCEEAAAFLAKQGIAVRAGLHCAPFAHESAGTLESGTVRVMLWPRRIRRPNRRVSPNGIQTSQSLAANFFTDWLLPSSAGIRYNRQDNS